MNTKKKFRENMDNIREFYKKEKGKQYPIVNPQLLKLEEYEKSSYIKMLCAITQYTESEHEMQIMYLQRLISGNQFELTLEDYMKKTLELSKEDVAEFINLYKESKLRYTFCIDGMILIGGQTKKDERQIEFLVELIELLGIKKDEIEYLIGFTRTVLTQDSKEYEKIINHKYHIKLIKDILFYIGNWFKGKLIDTDDELYYYAYELTDFNQIVEEDGLIIEYDWEPDEEPYLDKKIIYHNLKWSINESYRLGNAKQVEFINCKIDGRNSKSNIFIYNINKIKFKNCEILNFNSQFIRTGDTVKKIELIGNIFKHCGEDSGMFGGVFEMHSDYIDILVEKNIFEKCFLYNINSPKNIYGIIMSASYVCGNIKILNNQFNTMDSNKNSASLFCFERGYQNIIEENNQYIGGSDKLYE